MTRQEAQRTQPALQKATQHVQDIASRIVFDDLTLTECQDAAAEIRRLVRELKWWIEDGMPDNNRHFQVFVDAANMESTAGDPGGMEQER